MNFRGNTCVIGSEKFFALDLSEKFIKEGLDNGCICIFLGSKDLFDVLNVENKKDVIVLSNYKADEYENVRALIEDKKVYFVVTSEWMISNSEGLKYLGEKNEKNMQQGKYKILTYHNMMKLGIDRLEQASHIYDTIIFDNGNKRQIINVDDISNIRFLLKSIKKAKIENINLDKSRKNLQMLNNSIISFSFESNLEEIIKKTLKTALNITNADYGSITILYNNKKIEKEYTYSNIDLTYSYRIYSNQEIVGILTLGYKEGFYKGELDEYIINIICNNLGDLIHTFKEKEEGKFLKNSSNRIRFMGEVAGGIVHDLNNVFAIIKGYTQLLSITKEGNNIKDYIDIIGNVTEEAIEKIKTIQDFSRNIKEDKKYLSINDIIEKALETTRPKWENMSYINGRNVNIVLNLESKGNVFIKEADIRESVINMILNSIDSMPDGGNIYINSNDKEKFVIVEIIDEGIGIDADIIENIFNPFFTTKERSTGLGLSISKKNIEAHDGEIFVECRHGEGTKFTIKLPIREENEVCYV